MQCVEELNLEPLFDLDEIEVLPSFDVTDFMPDVHAFTFAEPKTFDTTLCTYSVTVANENPYNGVFCFAQSPSGRAPFTNNSNKQIPYKPEHGEFQPPSIAQPGQTVDADGVYSPLGTGNPTAVKIPDNMRATLDANGKLTAEINGLIGEVETLGGKLLGKETEPRQLTPDALSSEPFRNWPDPYSGRQWPYAKWDKPKEK